MPWAAAEDAMPTGGDAGSPAPVRRGTRGQHMRPIRP